MEDFRKKVLNASKWSAITEILAKCITPVTSMILARILAPEAFGILATVQMIIAFAQVFVDFGFQKFLIQHEFRDDLEEKQYMSVALIANVFVGMVLWLLLIIFNKPIAICVGDAGKGYLLAITGVTIPVYGIIGIQNCKLRKDLNFKKLFYVRMVSALVPLFITIPLALLGLDYWSLIIGNIAGVFINSIMLVLLKSFKPIKYFSFTDLKRMLDYGVWTLLNGIAVWLTSWVDAFLIGRYMTDYYLGLYKNSSSTITSIFAMVTSAITPVLFSSLSKVQNDNDEFSGLYINILKVLSMFLLPVGIGVFLYQDFVTDILLGSKWSEASRIIGITSLMTAVRTIYISLNGDVFRAKGYFKIPLFLQVAELIITIPSCIWGLSRGFWDFIYIRALSKVILIPVEIALLSLQCNVKFKAIVKSSWMYYFSSALMTVAAIFLKKFSSGSLWSILSIGVCAVCYFAVLLCIPNERNLIYKYIKKEK